jgi:hypothetical protein
MSLNKSIGASTFWPCERALLFTMVKALGLTWRETVSHLTLREAGESLLLSQGLFEKGQARFHGELHS